METSLQQCISTRKRHTILIKNNDKPHLCVTKPRENMKAAEDFLLVVLHAHIVAAAENIFKENIEVESIDQFSAKIVSKFVNLWKATDDDTTQLRNNSDGVFLYASSILTLGLLWMGFYDAYS